MLTTTLEKGGPSRILVVEDEAIIAEEIQDRLARLKFNVVGVEDSGARAIEAVQRTQPDLVLMDIRLKGKMDGIEAAAEIRKQANVPIVYLTAHTDPATLQRAKETAPLGYVLKPIHERELEVAIELAMHRHALESRLRESESRYAVTLDSIGDGVLVTDATGRITFLNRVAETLTGWKNSEAKGIPAEDVFVLLNETSREAITSPITRALESAATVRLSAPALLLTRDGNGLPIDDSAAPILGPNGELLGAVVALHDIRDRRQAESALTKAEMQLRQSQKLEAVGQLAGGVAHDCNNILTAINGYCELLLNAGTLDENAQRMVRRIFEVGERSAQLTRQLLAFSRKQKLSPRVIDLNRLVEHSTGLLRRLIDESITLELSLFPGIPMVLADAVQIEQIIMNLAVNARDAMPGGGVLRIETSHILLNEPLVGARSEMAVGPYVQISVSDTGVGMDPETQARIFEPFFTTKEHGKGTGLGLATVYGIVKQSGGFIYVYSEIGRGTVFKIFLPAVLNQAASASPPVAAPSRPWGTETILLVEDNDAVRQATAESLQIFGFRLICARNAAEALEIAGRQGVEIDMLVSDVVMPGLSGPALAEQLLKIHPKLPLLFITGYTDASIEPILHKIQELQLMQKPFMPAQLAGRIREILDQRKFRTG